MDKKSNMSNEFQESDLEVLKEYHEFVRDDQYDQENSQDWRVRLARRYYDELYKEYAIIDLSHYLAGLIGFRWRTEQEVVSGKGHQYCAATLCSSIEGLKSYEVPFGYEEQGVPKAELVKVTLCKKCSKKLKFYSEKQQDTEKSSSDLMPPKKKLKH